MKLKSIDDLRIELATQCAQRPEKMQCVEDECEKGQWPRNESKPAEQKKAEIRERKDD